MTRFAAVADVTPELEPGTRVEVRGRFGAHWAKGFEIAEVTAEGFLVRRLSDGTVLPVEFGSDDVRRPRRRETWWI